MIFKDYELRLLAGADDTYEIVKWDKHHKSFLVMWTSFDHLIAYALLYMLVQVSVMIMYQVYCYRNFNECHYRFSIDKQLTKHMFSYSGWHIFGNSASILNRQGVDLVRRDTREKIECSLDQVEEEVLKLLNLMQSEMLERARAHRDSHTYVAKNMDEFEKIFNEKSGFVKAMWCGNQECEDAIKEKLAVTSRCMPFEQETITDTCVCCGKPATKMVYWGRAY